jgi:hypothetical protein
MIGGSTRRSNLSSLGTLTMLILFPIVLLIRPPAAPTQDRLPPVSEARLKSRSHGRLTPRRVHPGRLARRAALSGVVSKICLELLQSNGVRAWDGHLTLVVRGESSKTLAPGGIWEASFSPDGRSMVFRDSTDHVWLAGADGTGARDLTTHALDFTFAGRWFYYTDGDARQMYLFRLLAPDGQPELVGSAPQPSWDPPASGYNAIPYGVSSDGEMVVVCNGTEDSCQLITAGNPPIQMPPNTYAAFSPDSRWLLNGCELHDNQTGISRTFCDTADWGNPQFAADDVHVALFSGGNLRVLDLTTAVQTQLPKPPFWPDPMGITSDGSRVYAQDGRGGAWFIDTSGGDWTQLGSDPSPSVRALLNSGGLGVSQDTRVLAFGSSSQGIVESVDGGPPRVITHDGKPLAGLVPRFLSPGNQGKASPPGGLPQPHLVDRFRPVCADERWKARWNALRRCSSINQRLVTREAGDLRDLR